MIRNTARVLAVAGVATFAGAAAAQAQVWYDPAFYASGPSVTVKYIGSSAAYYNIMQWFAVDYDDIVFNGNVVDYAATETANGPGSYVNMFANKNGPAVSGIAGGTIAPASIGPTPVITDYVITGLSLGQEVLLALFAQNEDGFGPGWMNPNPNWNTQDSNDYTYFSGPGRNFDNTLHLKVVENGGSYLVHAGGWEDIRNGGDFDYNDIMFEIEGVYMTPEPVTMTLLGTGLVGVMGAASRRRRQRKSDDV